MVIMVNELVCESVCVCVCVGGIVWVGGGIPIDVCVVL